MRLVILFDPKELDLTYDEKIYLAEEYQISPDAGYVCPEVLTEEDAIEEWQDEPIRFSINQKLLKAGLLNVSFLIDLCW